MEGFVLEAVGVGVVEGEVLDIAVVVAWTGVMVLVMAVVDVVVGVIVDRKMFAVVIDNVSAFACVGTDVF